MSGLSDLVKQARERAPQERAFSCQWREDDQPPEYQLGEITEAGKFRFMASFKNKKDALDAQYALCTKDEPSQRELAMADALEEAARIIDGYHDATCLACSDGEYGSDAEPIRPCRVARWLDKYHGETR